jgi:DNA modification methylase
MAAERVGRLCRGIEMDPLYVDLTIRRWQRLTGEHAINLACGRSFDELAALSEVTA